MICCAIALTPRGVDGDDRALDLQHFEQSGDRHDLIGLISDLD